MRTFLLALLSVALLPMAGCDSGDSGEDLDLSSFTISVGDEDEDTRSPALFGIGENDEGQEGFGLLLGATDSDFDNAQPFVAFVGLETELPDTGTYDLFEGTDATFGNLPEGEVVGLYFVPPADEEDDVLIYISESGSLRVSDSDDDEMSGSYTMRARQYVLGISGLEITLTPTNVREDISGEYRARREDGIVDEAPTLSAFGTGAIAQ